MDKSGCDCKLYLLCMYKCNVKDWNGSDSDYHNWMHWYIYDGIVWVQRINYAGHNSWSTEHMRPITY